MFVTGKSFKESIASPVPTQLSTYDVHFNLGLLTEHDIAEKLTAEKRSSLFFWSQIDEEKWLYKNDTWA